MQWLHEAVRLEQSQSCVFLVVNGLMSVLIHAFVRVIHAFGKAVYSHAVGCGVGMTQTV